MNKIKELTELETIRKELEELEIEKKWNNSYCSPKNTFTTFFRKVLTINKTIKRKISLI